MFGYITIDQPEIKFKDYYRYRAYYCGLCHALGKQHGQTARLSVGYDMTFLAVLLDGLYDSETIRREFRCIVHPAGHHVMLSNEFLDYAADMGLYMAYLKCRDDWEDERKISRKMYASLVSGRICGIEEKYPEKTSKIKEALGQLSELERENSDSFESAAGCFGRVVEEMSAYRNDIWEKYLRRIGFFTGKFIYLMDAHQDLKEDIEKGLYNPLKKLSEEPGYDEKIMEILTMMISEAADAFEMLPVEENMEILRNIIYSGVWNSIRKESSDDRSL